MFGKLKRWAVAHGPLAHPGISKWLERALYYPRFDRWRRENPNPLFESREELYAAAAPAGDVPVDYLEFGVYRGASLKWWIEHHKEPASRFYGFDSFEGLPEDWAWEPKGAFSTGGKVPEVDDPRCRFVVGYFQETLVPFLKSTPLTRTKILHFDADLFSSTLFVLGLIAPLLQPGDILLFDEYCVWMDEFRATEMIKNHAFPFTFEVLGHTKNWLRVAMRVTSVKYAPKAV